MERRDLDEMMFSWDSSEVDTNEILRMLWTNLVQDIPRGEMMWGDDLGREDGFREYFGFGTVAPLCRFRGPRLSPEIHSTLAPTTPWGRPAATLIMTQSGHWWRAFHSNMMRIFGRGD
jgi:hypothetical protein